MSTKQQERRKQILEAALSAFIEKGYDKTSMDEVVQVTGLSKGTIYWYFKNKEEMYTALIEYVVDQFFADFEVVLTSAQTMAPREAIAAIFETGHDMIDTNPRVTALTIDFMMQALHYPEMRRKYAKYYALYIEGLGAIIQRGIDSGAFRQVDARAASAALIGTLDGVMLQALIGDEIDLDWKWRLKDILKTAELLFLNGIEKEVSNDDD